MNTEHTEGPWTANKIEGKPLFNIRAGQQSIAQAFEHIGSNVLHDQSGQGEANARLIASAPELLAALESIRDTANRSDIGVLDRALLMFETAKAAIARATGQ